LTRLHFSNTTAVRQELRALTILGLPVIGTKLANMAIRITDTIMAGNISAHDLAAIAVGNGYSGTMMVLLSGILIAMNPIIGQLCGAKRHAEIGEKFRQGLWLSLLLGIVAILGLHLIGRFAGLDENLAPIADSYLKATCWGTPFIMVFHLLRNFNVAMGNTRPALFIILASIPVNIIGNLLFMHGYLGLPKMGAQGLGYASSLTWIFMFFSMLIWTKRHEGYAQLQLWKWALPRLAECREVLALGVPIGLTIAFEAGLYSVTMIFIGGLGAEMAAAHAITISISNLMYMIPAGIATAIGIRVSQAKGRGCDKSVHMIGKTGILLAGSVMLVCGLLTWSFPHLLIGCYTNDPALAKTTAGLLGLGALYQVFDGLQVSASAALRGLKDTKIPMLASAISFWLIGLPIGWYLGIAKGMAAGGFWVGLVAGLFSAAILHNLRFYCLTHPLQTRRLAVLTACFVYRFFRVSKSSPCAKISFRFSFFKMADQLGAVKPSVLAPHTARYIGPDQLASRDSGNVPSQAFPWLTQPAFWRTPVTRTTDWFNQRAWKFRLRAAHFLEKKMGNRLVYSFDS